MDLSLRYWMFILLMMVPVPAWANASSSNEVGAYALMEGYKIPFKIKTEAGPSKYVQNVRLTLDMDRIPTINLEGPIDSRLHYKSELSKISLCGVSDRTVCLDVLAHVELNTFIPVSGQMTFSCLLNITNESGKLSVDKVDITNLQIDPWLNGVAAVFGGEKTVASRIRNEIEKQLQAGKLDLTGAGLLSDLSAKKVNNNLEVSLRLKNRTPALKVLQTLGSQKSGNRIEIDAEQKHSVSRGSHAW